jgi:MFS family permease
MREQDLEQSLFVPYVTSLLVLAALCAALVACERNGTRSKCSVHCEAGKGWDLRFLIPFFMCAAADWLQGPYVYALYASYGYDRFTIDALFVVGFSASMVTGPFVGALADHFGVKRMILMGYCVVYMLACVTKHFDSLPWLYLGRLLGGTATSVLFSCFESWLVAEYTDKGQSKEVIGQALSRMYFVNGLAAVLMGPMAQVGADAHPLTPVGAANSTFHVGGDVTPFDMSFGFLLVGLVLVALLWSERYKVVPSTGGSGSEGREESSHGCLPGCWMAVRWLAGSPLALLLMAGSAFTEAAMYSFVIEWTPALTTSSSHPPHGIVFSAFMLAFMGGSTLLRWASSPKADSALLIGTSALGAFSMGGAALLAALHPTDAPLSATFSSFLCFVLFEACLGAYFTLVGSVKAKQVPEHLRAAVYGLFRVPLNTIVVMIQLLSPSSAISFLVAALLLATACVCFAAAHHAIKTGSCGFHGPTEASPLVKAQHQVHDQDAPQALP